MQEFLIGKNEAGQRFDKFLVKYLPGAPKGLLYKMLRKKNITLNDKKADGSEILCEKDKVKSFFSEETFEKFCKGSIEFTVVNDSALQKSISVVYEDSDILIIDKPAGVLSQKSVPTDYSVNEWLISYLLEKGDLKKDDLKTFKPSICNRLDRNTSGLLLCGKSLSGLQFLTDIIKRGVIQKYYLTLCHGEFSQPRTVSGILTKDNKNNISKVLLDEKDANIKTGFVPLEHLKGATLLEVNLHTGKPHQIRAQLLAIGHPIYGDKKYFDDNQLNDIDKHLKHQLLHCYKLVFPPKKELPEKYIYLADKIIEIKPSEIIINTISKLNKG